MRSEDLRALSADNLGLLSAWAEQGIECKDGTIVSVVGAAPFDLDEEPKPTATILQWNDPAQVRERELRRRADYRKAHLRKRLMSAVGMASREEPTAPQQAPPKTWKREHIYPTPVPQTKLAQDLAKQLIAFAGSLRDSDIAKAARVPVETVEQLRAERTP